MPLEPAQRFPRRVHQRVLELIGLRVQRGGLVLVAAVAGLPGGDPVGGVQHRDALDRADGQVEVRHRVRVLAESLAALAVQIAALRGQVALINQRLDRAGLRGDLDLAARFEELAQTVADALDAAAPRGPAAPYWIGLDRQAHEAQLAELRQWADTVLRRHYGGYELRDCWTSHIHAIWELSTLAAAWHHAYGGERPDLARALEFYDRWLPGTMRRIAHMTRTCVPECATRRRPLVTVRRPRPLPQAGADRT